MSNIVSIFKNKKDMAYEAKVKAMDKLDLMEEMLRFQEERSAVGHLTPDMIIREIVLFGELANAAETPELHLLANSYRRHLEYELSEINATPND